MKTLIITIVVLLLNLSGLISKDIKNIDNVKTIEEFREVRFQFLTNPTTNRPHPYDTDRYIYGSIILEINKENIRQSLIKNKIQEKQQPQKIKSTYLDFTILQEENIS
jgi:hypothetical protein